MADTSFFTPDDLLWRFNDAVWNKGTTGNITVRGIYIRQDFPLNDGRWIDKIASEINDVRINIVVSENLRKVLEDGNVIVINGFLDRYVDNKDGSIRLQIRVKTADVFERTSLLSAKEIELSAIRHQKMLNGYKSIDALLLDKIEKGISRIAMVYPTSSIVHYDFIREAKDATRCFYFEDVRTSFTSVQQLLSTLQDTDKQQFDVICLVRGGGNDFGALTSPEVLKGLVAMKTPTIAAIGHENDKLFINEIVDKSFSTPTSLGGYFKRLADDLERKHRQVQELKDTLLDRERTNDELKTKLKKAVWAIVGISLLLIGALVFYFSR